MVNRLLKRTYLIFVYIFFYLPLLIVFWYSFNNSKYTINWTGFSVRWYEKLFNNSALIDAAFNSLFVALCAATIATILGTITALCIKRYTFVGKNLLSGSVMLLTVSPDIVMGIAFLLFFITIKMELGFLTLLIAHTTLCAPFVTVTVLSRLTEFDERLIEAARDLGASEAEAFRYVLLPLTAPAIAAGWLLSFSLSIDDILISTFTTGPHFEVLPVKIYSMVKLGVKPDVNALSAIMFGLTLFFALLAQFIYQKRRK